MRASVRSVLFCSVLQVSACAGDDDSEGLSDSTPCRWRIESEDGKDLARSSGLCELVASGIDPLNGTDGLIIMQKSGSLADAPPEESAAELVLVRLSTELHTEPWSFEVRGSENPDKHVFMLAAQQYEAGLPRQAWTCNAANSPPVRLHVRFTEIDHRGDKSRVSGVVDAVCAADPPSASVPAVRIHAAFDFKNVPLL